MKTRDRILHSALQLFNEQGAAKVTTNAIADETDVSVGNLYYHFKNKEEILLTLLKVFKKKIQPLIEAEVASVSLVRWSDWWYQWFNQVEAFSFLFHNQQYLMTLDNHLLHLYQKLVHRLQGTQKNLLMELKNQGNLVATEADIERMTREVTFIAFFWRDFLDVQFREHSATETPFSSALQQVLGLLLPYMKVAEQMAMEQLIAQLQAHLSEGDSR